MQGLAEEYKDSVPHAGAGRNQHTAASSSHDQGRRLQYVTGQGQKARPRGNKGARSERTDGAVFKSLDYEKLVKSDDGAPGADQGIMYKKGRMQRPKTGAAHNAAGSRAANIRAGFQHKGLLSAKSNLQGHQTRASASNRMRQTAGEASGTFNLNSYGEATLQRNISTAGYSSAVHRGLERSLGAGSTHALTGRLLGCTTATALSRVVPKTNIPVIDEYYRNFDTQGQIDQIKFTTEFQRLCDKIEKYWHVK